MAKYIIPEARKGFLLSHFKEFSFIENGDGEDIEADRDVFDSITEPAEIFFIVENYNWDDGSSVLDWIIDSPLCTKAAALIIFWTSAPDYYMEYEFGSNMTYSNGGVDEDNTSILNLLEKLVKRFEAGDFCEYQIKFDFNYWAGSGRLDVDNPKWSVSQEFFDSIDGVEVI